MKELKLLQTQIDKLQNKDFDLDAWKQYTVVLLARIFGENDPKIRQIEKIEYDFSSWSLRDTSGKSSYMDTCKKLGREVLQASIDELITFGLPDKKEGTGAYIPTASLINSLEEELKISEYRKLVSLISSDVDQDKKQKELIALIKTFGKGFSDNVLVNLLSDKAVQEVFNS